jgi:regulator of replication initiation timing
MYKNSLLFAIILFLFSACSNENKEAVENTRTQIDSVLVEKSSSDTAYQRALSEINDMNENLDALLRKRNIMLQLRPEHGETRVSFQQKLQIIANELDQQTDLIRRSSRKLDSLEKVIKTIQRKYSSLLNSFDSLLAANAELREENDNLRVQLANATTLIQLQQDTIASLRTLLAEKNKIINTAYYLIGTEDELEKKKIVESKGGILGIRSTTVLTGNLEKMGFTEIDIKTTKEFSIDAEDIDDIKILSTHSSSSYTMEKTEEKKCILRILDELEFWKSSKFLVVEID